MANPIQESKKEFNNKQFSYKKQASSLGIQGSNKYTNN